MHLKVIYFINVPNHNVNLQVVINTPRRRTESMSSQMDLSNNVLNEASEEKQQAAGGKNSSTGQFKLHRHTIRL